MRSLKILGVALLSFFAVLLLAIAIVPLVVDVDRFRPQLAQRVESTIDGKANLGRLSLSLWGGIRFKMDGMEIQDLAGREVVSVADAAFQLPYSSLWAGSPVMTLQLDRPEINLGLIKNLKKDQVAQPPSEGGTRVELPDFVARSRIGLSLDDGVLTYKDPEAGLDVAATEVNLIVRDLSLTQPTEIEGSAKIASAMGEKGTITGPIRFDAMTEPTVNDGKVETIVADFRVDMDDLAIRIPETFEKSEGIPTNVEGKVIATADQIRVERWVMRLHDLTLAATGTIKQGPTPFVNLNIQANEQDLESWRRLVPALEKNQMDGLLALQMRVTGAPKALVYQGKLEMKELTAQSPWFKAQPKVGGTVEFDTAGVSTAVMSLNAPSTQAAFNVRVTSLTTAPVITGTVTSPGMDFDSWLVVPETEEKSDFDAMLGPVRTNPMAQKASAQVTWNLAWLQYGGTRIEKVTGRGTYKNQESAVEDLRFAVFGGQVQASSLLRMKTEKPTYRFSTQVKGLRINDVVASKFEVFKNTLEGVADFELEGQGSSLNPDQAAPALNAKGGFKVTNAAFKTIDVAKATSGALQQTADRLGGQFPQLRPQLDQARARLGSLPEVRYSEVSSHFSIRDGVFEAPDFLARAVPEKGIDIQGKTRVGFVGDQRNLQGDWLLVDSHNLTKLNDLSLEVEGVKVEHILAKPGQPVQFPVAVACTLAAPCYQYKQVPEYFSKLVASNLTQSLRSKARAELQKMTEEPKKQAEDDAKKMVEEQREKAKKAAKDLFQ